MPKRKVYSQRPRYGKRGDVCLQCGQVCERPVVGSQVVVGPAPVEEVEIDLWVEK